MDFKILSAPGQFFIRSIDVVAAAAVLSIVAVVVVATASVSIIGWAHPTLHTEWAGQLSNPEKARMCPF